MDSLYSMEDRYGHKINYLRISITDRCNERCLYCMPQELQEWLPRDEILTYDCFDHSPEAFTGLGAPAPHHHEIVTGVDEDNVPATAAR